MQEASEVPEQDHHPRACMQNHETLNCLEKYKQCRNTCISWSSVKADKLTKMGNRPINSGMRPYAIRSALST